MGSNLPSLGWSLWCEIHLSSLWKCSLCPSKSKSVRQFTLFEQHLMSMEQLLRLYISNASTYFEGEKLL